MSINNRLILPIDTETIPTQNPALMARIALQEGGDSDKVDKAHRKTSLSPLFGELFCVSFAIGAADPVTLSRGADYADPQSEVKLLTELASDLNDIKSDHRNQPITFAAHNAPFDQGFIRGRALIRGVKMPQSIMVTRKPWDRYNQWWCSQAAWSDRERVRLDDMMLALGRVDLLKGDIDGSKVWDAVYGGRFAQVEEYNREDVRRVWAAVEAMFLATRGEPTP